MTVENTSLQCPRCHVPLNPQGNDCTECGGQFVDGSSVRDSVLENADTKPSELKCPRCDGGMVCITKNDVEVDRCESCGGVWMDLNESLGREKLSAGRMLLYGLTLPERLVRSTVGVAAGAAMETATLIVPRSFQNARTYEIVVRNSLGFLTQNIGGVQGEPTAAADEDFVARKAVGNFVDLAGWATLHASPVWMLAIVSDVAYGTKTYVVELAKELESQGLIDDSSTIHNVDDVLDAVQNATGEAATMFDTPPLSVADLKESLDTTKAALQSADYRSILPEAEIARFWGDMKGVAQQENVSLVGVSGALAMNTLGKLNTVSRGTVTGVKVVGGLFNEHVVQHYTTSLKTIHEQGFFQTVRESSEPYVEAVWTNFSSDSSTLTEEIVSGRAPARIWGKVKGWFTGDKTDESKLA